jgi:hypothetical protein
MAQLYSLFRLIKQTVYILHFVIIVAPIGDIKACDLDASLSIMIAIG